MDASQITKMREKQQTQFINRKKCNDASTLIWMNQIQSSKYIKGITTCSGLQQTSVPTEAGCSNKDGTCSYGNGKSMAIATGSSQRYPSVFRGASGSASEIYSSDRILLQKAGRNYCSELISDPPPPITVIPPICSYDMDGRPICYYGPNGPNGPTDINPATSIVYSRNPYLPEFDKYYSMKNKPFPVIDQNQKHHVAPCCPNP